MKLDRIKRAASLILCALMLSSDMALCIQAAAEEITDIAILPVAQFQSDSLFDDGGDFTCQRQRIVVRRKIEHCSQSGMYRKFRRSCPGRSECAV